jgi:hypothetical protein
MNYFAKALLGLNPRTVVMDLIDFEERFVYSKAVMTSYGPNIQHLVTGPKNFQRLSLLWPMPKVESKQHCLHKIGYLLLYSTLGLYLGLVP